MKRLLWILPLIALIGAGVYFWLKSGEPPAVRVAKPSRTRLETRLATNGKVEPMEYVVVRAGRGGKVSRISVKEGDSVVAGQFLVELDSAELRAQLATIEARIPSAQAEAKVIEQGGSKAQLTDLDNQTVSLRQQLATAEQDLATFERLRARNAATDQQVLDAKRRVDQLKTDLTSVERRRGSLVQDSDRTVAEARIRGIKSEAAEIRTKLADAVVTAPLSGRVYQLTLKPGGFVNPGDEIARIGRVEKVRIQVYIDEPDLGKVKLGTPVDITWDAYPGRIWNGAVDRLATQVVALGSRQVGEVYVAVGNEDRTLLPGTNINADVKVAVVEQALSIPREALRRKDERDGVLILENGMVKFRSVEVGASSASRFEVKSGLSESDSVILPAEFELKEGMKVQPQP